MNVSVSMREFSDLPSQIKDAVSFLQTHHEELSRLRDFPGNEGATMDFPVQDRDVMVQCDAFPPELLLLLGDLRIELAISRYPQTISHPEATAVEGPM
jgi:hypothetical protein